MPLRAHSRVLNRSQATPSGWTQSIRTRRCGDRLKAELLSQQPLTAPLAKGQRVGTLRITFDEKPYAEYPLVALEPVGPAGLLGRGWDTLRLWIKRFF